MEECTEIAMLLDFYGQLLTPRQYEILDLHYNSDFSLGEIAGHLNISRQGVYDGVKRGKKTLKSFEKKLGLIKRFSKHEYTLRNVVSSLKKLQARKMGPDDKELIYYCVDKLENVINDL